MSENIENIEPNDPEKIAENHKKHCYGEFLSHPSYGSIAITRFTGGDGAFFASDNKHNGGISIRINMASLHDYGTSRYVSSGKRIIEIEMSSLQFADLITSMNHGDGLPCTLKYVPDVVLDEINGTGSYSLAKIEKPDIKNVAEHYAEEFNEATKDLLGRILILEKMIQESKAKKSEVAEIRSVMIQIKNEITSNHKHRLKQLSKTIEKMVSSARKDLKLGIGNNENPFGLIESKNE